jgi:hypothetical protein
MRPYILFSLALPALAATPSWSDVQPILQSRCSSCHAPGEIAPMSFLSHAETRPWARAIRTAVASRKMPPWHAAPSPHAFLNDRSLSQKEIDTLTQWADAGAPGPQSPAIKPAAKSHKQTWKLGAPDRIVQIPGMQVPASGQLPYTFLIIPLNLKHDTWLRAAEFQIDQRAVIHHINAFIRPPGSSYLAGFPVNEFFVPTVAQRGKRHDNEKLFDRRQLLLGYEPGYAPMPWLDNGAKLIPAGSDLIFEMHYNPNGKPAVDNSQFALYFSKSTPQHRVLAIDTLRDLDFLIPPQSPNFLSNASMTLARDVQLLSLQPHMHTRGAAMRVTATFPDGRTETLIDVPQYDFNWQTTYVLKQPLQLPTGTVLRSTAKFDNSPNNPHNPDPAAQVKWGDQTTDEMHIAFLELVLPAAADPNALLAAQPKMVGPTPPKP